MTSVTSIDNSTESASHQLSESAEKQIQDALRDSEERYLLAEWATNDGLWDWNPVTDVCYFSPQFHALLGLENCKLKCGAHIFARLHEDSAAVLFEAVRAHFDENRPYDVEIQVRVSDGRYRWFRSRGRAAQREDGKVIRMVGSMTDIHDSKWAESLSKEHDNQLRSMIDSIDLLAWMAHADGYIFWYNRRWYEYTGTTSEQMAGWGWQSVHNPEILPSVMERWTGSIRCGQAFEMVFPLRGQDGVFRSFLTRIVPVRDSAGKIVLWFGTNTNVDDLRREQDLLRESERQLRELAESLPEIVWSCNPRGEFTFANAPYYIYTGTQLANPTNWIEHIHAEQATEVAQCWKQSLTTGQKFEFQARLKRADGTFRWHLHRAQQIKDESGKVTRWLGTSTDIHEQKLTEQALRQSNEDLEQFGYAAGHDLQEPLRLLTLYAQMLVRGMTQGKASADYACEILRAAKQMDSLLKGILAYSRTADTTEPADVTDTQEALGIALSNLNAAVQDSGAAITNDELPPIVFPATQLGQVFQNLIGNAIKYRGNEPLKIHISALRTGAFYEFSIKDNGIGIRREFLERIFGIFKRLHTDEYPGAGVGLAICKRIVERQGGRIWADSEVDQGTTFYFTVLAFDR